MANNFELKLIKQRFYVGAERPNALRLLSYWKKTKYEDGSPKMPPFQVRLHRQVAGGINDDESNNINARNLWNVNNNYIYRELREKYPRYITSLQNKKKLELLYKISNLRKIPFDVVNISIGDFF